MDRTRQQTIIQAEPTDSRLQEFLEDRSFVAWRDTPDKVLQALENIEDVVLAAYDESESVARLPQQRRGSWGWVFATVLFFVLWSSPHVLQQPEPVQRMATRRAAPQRGVSPRLPLASKATANACAREQLKLLTTNIDSRIWQVHHEHRLAIDIHCLQRTESCSFVQGRMPIRVELWQHNVQRSKIRCRYGFSVLVGQTYVSLVQNDDELQLIVEGGKATLRSPHGSRWLASNKVYSWKFPTKRYSERGASSSALANVAFSRRRETWRHHSQDNLLQWPSSGSPETSYPYASQCSEESASSQSLRQCMPRHSWMSISVKKVSS